MYRPYVCLRKRAAIEPWFNHFSLFLDVCQRLSRSMFSLLSQHKRGKKETVMSIVFPSSKFFLFTRTSCASSLFPTIYYTDCKFKRKREWKRYKCFWNPSKSCRPILRSFLSTFGVLAFESEWAQLATTTPIALVLFNILHGGENEPIHQSSFCHTHRHTWKNSINI